MIDAKQLKQIMPNCRHPQDWIRPLYQAMHKYGIDENEQRTAAFIGQVAHESGELKRLEENLNYSPGRLVEVWPKRFPTVADARAYSRNPEKLANLVYASRLGNGPYESGDGFRYRGRGLIQVTGRYNYEQAAEAMDLPELVEMPDYLLEPRYAALSAAAFWNQHDLNDIADKLIGEINTVVKKITKVVNGGDNGLEDRIGYTQRALDVLTPEHAGIDTAPDNWLETEE